MKPYNHQKIEKKWQSYWEKKKLFQAKDGDKGKKFYGLIEFPYPSGDGLHVGHIRSNTAMDIILRKRRAEGFNVLYPIGWDAFGLPTENYAIKTGKKPQDVTKKNTDTFRRQLKAGGFSFDWSREVNTTDPKYYKWTQWIFLQLYKKGLAYKAKTEINWCPKDLIGLANEEVVNGCCERCGTPVEKRVKEQWMLAITKYADRLDRDLDTVDFLEKIKIQQRNWIGRSEGAEIEFALQPEKEPTFYQFFEPGTIKEGEPFVERDAILAVVKHWKEDKYIGLKWKKVAWETLITGGVEKGQTPEQAARAEILEETGYKNLKLVKKLGGMHSKFFHVPKNQNRYAHFSVFYFELQDGERNELSEEEKANHEPVWLSSKQMESFKLPSSHRYVWDTVRMGAVPEKKVKVFTTRPDTLYGVTYLVLSPEHPLAEYFIHQASNAAEIDSYRKKAAKKSEADRTAEGKEKTGVELKGVKAINPVSGEALPIYISDYVLAGYGTGAIMAVPAHDERDFAFARKFDLPVREVLVPNVVDKRNPPREDKKTVERKNVHAIVLNPRTGMYLGLKWKEHPWTTFPMGGAEAGETAEQAARREVAEETGYTNLKLVRVLPRTVRAEYFAAHKDQNRVSITNAVLFELENENKVEVGQEEKDAHEVIWLSEADLKSDRMTHAEMDHWNAMLSGNTAPFVGDGYLINSGAYTSMKSLDAKRILTESAGGKMVTTYKLRDWVFSRQRYWGEPIPMVHCPSCAFKKHKSEAKLSLNFYYDDVWEALQNGTKTIESRALNPHEPERFFGNVAVGDILHFTRRDKKSKKIKAEMLARVEEARVFKDFDALFAHKETLAGFKQKTYNSAAELKKSYERYAPGYGKDGIVTWKITILTEAVPVAEKNLPVKLPPVKNYKPTQTGESPLALIEKWVKTKCPVCKGPARRETDTMPNWAGSSWYYLRYTDPKNKKALASAKNLKYWTPVDWYNGGMEHTTLHLLYSRFWHKFLYDIKAVPTSEPYSKRTSHGLILAEGGVKMSKSIGNVINPDEIIKLYGADTLRVYEMFMGPFDQPVAWSTESIIGARRFIERIWRLAEKVVTMPASDSKREALVQKTIKKVSEDIEGMRFNTAISSLMILLNEFEKSEAVSKNHFETLLRLVAPFAPHAAEELWNLLGNKDSIGKAPWLVADESLMRSETQTIVVQINGKVRGQFEIETGLTEVQVKEQAREVPEIKSKLAGKQILKEIYVKGRLINFVVVE